MTESPNEPVPILEQIRSMRGNYWTANLIEALERLCFWGVRGVLPLYMVGPNSALMLSMTEKGVIFTIWALFQCVIPMVSGGYTEEYGYKKTMYAAFALNIAGFCIMANATGFWTMLVASISVGCGTAIFKPPVQGAVARSLNDGNSSLGFGIFYWMVNVGAMIGPFLAAPLRGDSRINPTWENVFYAAALVTAVNYLPAIFLFREPEKKHRDREKTPVQVFAETMKTLWNDKPMLRFLLVISGFWFMFMQLWDTLPNFIDQWLDSRDIGAAIPAGVDWLQGYLQSDGGIKPEVMINIDATTIVILVIPLSWLLGRLIPNRIACLLVGMALSLVGFVGAGMSQVGFFVAGMIFVFAIGEITFSPKYSEYVGMTAPPDKKAVYMGFVNIPWAIGWAFGNLLSGPLYDWLSSKSNLAREYMVEKLNVAASFFEGGDPLPTKYMTEMLAARLNGEPMEKIAEVTRAVSSKVAALTQAAEKGEITAEVLTEKTTEALRPLQDLGGGHDAYDVTRVLWETYHPWIIWIVLGAIGVVSFFWMWLIYIQTKRAKDEPAAGDG